MQALTETERALLDSYVGHWQQGNFVPGDMSYELIDDYTLSKPEKAFYLALSLHLPGAGFRAVLDHFWQQYGEGGLELLKIYKRLNDLCFNNSLDHAGLEVRAYKVYLIHSHHRTLSEPMPSIQNHLRHNLMPLVDAWLPEPSLPRVLDNFLDNHLFDRDWRAKQERSHNWRGLESSFELSTSQRQEQLTLDRRLVMKQFLEHYEAYHGAPLKDTAIFEILDKPTLEGLDVNTLRDAFLKHCNATCRMDNSAPLKELEQWLQENPDYNLNEVVAGHYPLSFALMNDVPGLVELLHRYGARVAEQVGSEEPALLDQVLNGPVDRLAYRLRRLQNCGFDIDSRSPETDLSLVQTFVLQQDLIRLQALLRLEPNISESPYRRRNQARLKSDIEFVLDLCLTNKPSKQYHESLALLLKAGARLSPEIYNKYFPKLTHDATFPMPYLCALLMNSNHLGDALPILQLMDGDHLKDCVDLLKGSAHKDSSVLSLAFLSRNYDVFKQALADTTEVQALFKVSYANGHSILDYAVNEPHRFEEEREHLIKFLKQKFSRDFDKAQEMTFLTGSLDLSQAFKLALKPWQSVSMPQKTQAFLQDTVLQSVFNQQSKRLDKLARNLSQKFLKSTYLELDEMAALKLISTHLLQHLSPNPRGLSDSDARQVLVSNFQEIKALHQAVRALLLKPTAAEPSGLFQLLPGFHSQLAKLKRPSTNHLQQSLEHLILSQAMLAYSQVKPKTATPKSHARKIHPLPQGAPVSPQARKPR